MMYYKGDVERRGAMPPGPGHLATLEDGDMMNQHYVDVRDGGYWITGTRISLDSLVYAFHRGQTAESIAQSFPLLSLEMVYGAIAFYLANRDQIDDYLAKARGDYEELRRAARDADPAFYQKLADARRAMQAS